MASNMELTVVDPRKEVEGKLNKMSEDFHQAYGKLNDRFRSYHATYMQNCADFEHYQQERFQISQTLSDIVESLKDLRSNLEEEVDSEGTTLHSRHDGDRHVEDVEAESKSLVKSSRKKVRKCKVEKKPSPTQPEAEPKSRCIIS